MFYEDVDITVKTHTSLICCIPKLLRQLRVNRSNVVILSMWETIKHISFCQFWRKVLHVIESLIVTNVILSIRRE
jgi:hypothetical protein